MALNLSGLKNKTKSNNLDLSGLLKAGIPSYGRLARTTPTAPTLNQFKTGTVPIVSKKLSVAQPKTPNLSIYSELAKTPYTNPTLEFFKSMVTPPKLEPEKEKPMLTGIGFKKPSELPTYGQLSRMGAKNIPPDFGELTEDEVGKRKRLELMAKIRGINYSPIISTQALERLVFSQGTLSERQIARENEIISVAKQKPEKLDLSKTEELFTSIAQGTTQAISAIGSTLETTGRKYNLSNVEKIGEAVSDHFQKEIAKHPEWAGSTTLKGWTDPRTYIRLVGQGLPSIAGAIATSVATGVMAGGNPIAGLAGGFAFTKALEGGFAYQEAIQNGATEEQAQKIATMVGNINGALEMLPIERLLSKNPAWKKVKGNIIRRITGEFIKQGLWEGTTEGLQEIVNNAIQKEIDENRGLFDGVLESFVGGALLGGLTGVGATLTTPESRKEIKDITKQAVADQRGFAKLPFVKEETTETKQETPDQSLLQEAKKYKSAEEFVKAQTNVFHGTPEKGFKLEKGKPLFLTEDFDEANTYAGYSYNTKPTGEVVEFYAKNGKSLDLNKTENVKKVFQEIYGSPKLKKTYNQIPEEYKYLDDYGDVRYLEPRSSQADFEDWMMMEYQSKPKIENGLKVKTRSYSFEKETQQIRKNLQDAFSVYGKPTRQSVYNRWDDLIKYGKQKGYDFIEHTTESPDTSILFPEKIALNPEKSLLTKSQLTDIWNKAQGGSLVQEARKYKSAEEFIKAQGTPVYRGQNSSEFTMVGKSAGIGKSFTTDKNVAGVYGNQGKIIDGFVNNEDILRYGELDGNTKKYIKSIIDEKIDRVKIELGNENIKPFEELVLELGEIARIKNKKAIDISSFGIPSESEIRILSKDALKTKSQLTDIWNKANQATPEASLIAEAKKYKSAEEFVDSIGEETYKKIYKPIQSKVDDISVNFESTCVDCKGGADFVDNQMAKAIEVPKKGKWANKIREQWAGKGGFRNGKIGNRIDDYDTSLYLTDDYLIFQESGIEYFYKLENAPKINFKSQLIDIWNKAHFTSSPKGEGSAVRTKEQAKYKIKPVLAFKREKGIGSEITGEEAIKNARRVLKKLKISGVNYNKVDKILTGDGGEAIASSFGSDVNFTDIVSAFAGEHEVGHTYFKTLSKERQGAILQKMREFYPNIKSNYDLEEELMINLEIYLNTKKTNQKGIIKSFFDEVMAFLHRVFSKNNLDIIHNFYREIEKGRGVFAKKIEIKRKTSPIITEGGKRVIDYTKYRNAKFQKTKDQEYDELSDEDKESLAQWQQQQIDEIRGAYEFDDEEMEIGYNNFVDALKKPKLFSKRELIETGDADRIKQIFIDAGIYKTKEDVGNALGFNNSEYSDDEVLEMIKDRIMEENPALLVGKKNILNLTGKPPTKSERKAIDEKIDVLDPEIKRMAEAYFRPPRNLNARAFNLLSNKDTTVPLFTSIFSRWVSNGIDTIIEPYAGAFTLGSYSIKNAIRNGLKSYYANVYDIEKNIIIRAIADGNIDEVKLKLNSSVQKLNGLILDLSSKAKDGTYVVFSNFLKENKDSYIGSNAWKNYIRKEKIGKDVTVFKENYLKYKTIFDEAVKLMQDDDVNNLQSALDRAFIERIEMRGNELISKQIGFQSFEDKVFGKYGMTSGFDAIKETFDLAKEHGTTIDIGNGNENGWDFVNRINIADAQKTGFYFDPPYVKSSATYKGKEVSREFLKEHFGNPDRFVSDHQKAFNSVKNGSRIVLTNDVHNDYIKTILKEVPNDSFQVYREGLTPTSLMSDIDTTGMITDFFATSYNSKAKEIWADMEYLAEAIKRGGYTEKTIKRLREHGVSEEIINILKIEDKYLKNLVKVKIEPNGEVSATISKEALAYINRTSKIKDLDKKWIKQYSLDYFKKGTFDTFQGYETGARFFLRIGKGFKNLLFDPIITGERLAAKQTEELKDRIKTVLSLTKKEAEDLFYFTASKQGKDVKAKSLDQLSDNTRKAYSEIRSVVRELYPEVKKVALKNGREIGEVENYSPLYTSDDYKLLDVGGFDFTRKDPFFGSIKERVEDVPIELYEKDYRKVMEAWINGVSRYINVGSRTLPIKYLIDSLELQEIAGKDIHSKLNEWYRNIVSPQQPKGVEKGLRFFRKLNAMGILAVKYTVIFKQFLNIADFWVLSSGVRLMKSPINIAKNSTIARLASMSGSVQQRGLGYEVADLRGIIIKWMRKPAEFTDQLTAKMGKIALMEQMIDRLHKEGKEITPKELKRIDRISDDIVDAVMGSMSKADQPAYFRSELGKAINMFYSQLNSKMQFYVTDIWKDPKMAEMSGSKKKLLAKSLVAILLAGWMEQLISKLYFDDPEDEVKDTIKGVIGNFPIIGSLMFALETGQPYSPSPILSNMIKLISAISQGKTEDIIWSAAGFMGFSSQIEDLIRGGYVVYQGGVYDKKGKKLFSVDSLPEQIRTILKGKWGSKAAQEYFEPTKTNKTKRKSSGLR